MALRLLLLSTAVVLAAMYLGIGHPSQYVFDERKMQVGGSRWRVASVT